jgi:ABC-type amino acid transport substrate-binding protein
MVIGRTGSPLDRWAFLVLLVTVGLVACFSPSDPTWERVQETQILRVGMDASFPPFEAIAADGSPVGFDVDLAREVSHRLGVEPRFVANLPYDGLYDALTARRVDVVISALVVNPARTADFAYSRVYFDAGQVLVVRQGAHTMRSVGDLDAHSVAVVLGSPGDREARDWARRSNELVVMQYPTPAEALRAVRVGEMDAALVDHVSALQAIGQGSDLTIVGEPVLEVPYAVAMREDSKRLLRAIDSALAAMEDDGTLDRLVTEWLKAER